MFTTNNGGVPGANTPIEKAPGACDSKGLTTVTNTTDFRSYGATDQAHGTDTVIARLTAICNRIRSAASSFYAAHGIIAETTIMLVVTVIYIALEALQ